MPPNQYGKVKDRQSKREAREAQAQGVDQEEKGTFPRPVRGKLETFGVVIEAPTETTRLYVQAWLDGGVIAEFVMLHFIHIGVGDEGWYQLARVDCAHACAHIHIDDVGLSPPITEPVRVLHTIEDVQQAYNEAHDVIFKRWREREWSYTDARRAHPKRHRPTGRLPQGDLPDDC